jgi:ATP-binding cassette subfamily F protein 3
MLGKIIAQNVNLLFLDEPTNHLDIDSIKALTNAIKAFEGSCIIVTHSEELLRDVCDRLIVFRNEGADYFNGTYDEFLEKIGWDEDDMVEEKKAKPAKPKLDKKERKKLRAAVVQEKSKTTSPIRKEIESLDVLIPTLSGNDRQSAQKKLDTLKVELEELNVLYQAKLDEIG